MMYSQSLKTNQKCKSYKKTIDESEIEEKDIKNLELIDRFYGELIGVGGIGTNTTLFSLVHSWVLVY